MEQFLDAKQLSKKLSIPRGTLYCWISRKMIPFEKIGEGKKGLVRFIKRDIEAWLEAKKREQRRKNFEE